MMKFRTVLPAMGLALLSMGLVVNPLVAPAVHAAEEEQKVSPKVGKPLQDALSAGQKKAWDEALAKLREAQAVPEKTAFDEFKINEIFGFVYLSQKKYAEAAAAYEKTLDSSFLPAADAEQRLKQVTQLYIGSNNKAKAMEYLQRWLKTHPNDTDMTAVLGQLQYQSGQYKAAIDTMNGVITATEKAGQAPKEAYLQIVYASNYKQLENPARPDKSTVAILEKLLRYYPKPTYWEALLVAMAQQQSPDAVRFQLDRLMLAVGVLKSGTEYFEMAQLANNFGFPGEALSVLETGYEAKALGVNAGKERDDRLMAQIKKAAESDRSSLPAQDKKARAAATGDPDALLGEAYYGYGQYPQAIEALERGLGKGGVKKVDQAQIALGISYLRNKQADQAKAAFKKVPADSELGRIASLWAIHASAN